jgi:hypothetical protein
MVRDLGENDMISQIGELSRMMEYLSQKNIVIPRRRIILPAFDIYKGRMLARGRLKLCYSSFFWEISAFF